MNAELEDENEKDDTLNFAVPQTHLPTPALCAELDRRIEAMEKDATAGNPWETIKRRLLNRS